MLKYFCFIIICLFLGGHPKPPILLNFNQLEKYLHLNKF